VELIGTQSIVRDPEPSASPLGVDADDEYLIDLAREARVGARVSGDAHLLDLCQAVPAVSPGEFLTTLGET
jgi:predicted nucleic acid-binding protein